MKIILPVHHFPPRYSAGAELYTFRLAQWLIAHGHPTDVVCVEHINLGEPDQLIAERDTYRDVPVWRLSFNMAHASDTLTWSYNNPLIGQWFHNYLQREQPDLVHLQSGYLISGSVLEATYRKRIAAVVTLHDYWFLCPRITLQRGDGSICETIPNDPAGCAWCMHLASRRFRLPDQMTGGILGKVVQTFDMTQEREGIQQRREYLLNLLGHAQMVVAPSHFLGSFFTDVVQPERMTMLRYGLDVARLQSTPVRSADGMLRIGYIGQIAPHKGVHVLVEAVLQLATSGIPVELTIYGNLDQDKRYTQRLRSLIGDDKRIVLAGRFDNSRITEVLGSFDMTVVPSIWYENSPLAIMEAHAAGRPVITSALGGMAELVRHNVDGLHFRAGDAVDLSRQIQRLRDEPHLLAHLRAGIRVPATLDEEMQSLLQVYDKAQAMVM